VWRELYCSRKKVYMTYAFTVIQIKNKILQGLMKDWKTFTRFRLIKKHCGANRESKMKRQLFKELKLTYLKGQQKLSSYEYIKFSQLRKHQERAFSTWRRRFLTKIERKNKLSDWLNNKIQ